MKKVYICEDTITGVFSAVYEAWKTKLLEEQLGIAIHGKMNRELFCEYIEIEEEEKKAVAVEHLILRHLGEKAYWDIYHAALAEDCQKGNAILGAMLEARQIADRTKIMDHLTHPQVRKVFELSRKVSNEAHYFREFVRFAELENGVLFSKIEPKNQILTCIADHFSNRLPLENWLIYDATHHMFLVHQAEKRWLLVVDEKLNMEKAGQISSSEKMFSNLWKGFFENISIKERESYKRQRQHLPLYFRQNMVEFRRLDD